MEPKKTPKADIESKKGIFFQIGIIIALFITLCAFEKKFYEGRGEQWNTNNSEDVIEEDVPITKQDIKPPEPPKTVEADILNIVEDETEVEEEFSIDAEATQSTEVQEYVPVTEQEDEIEEKQIFTIVEKAPSFPGGDAARIKFMQENIKYPQMAKESGIQGTVYITFVVERNGSVSKVKILRGIGGGCDEEAIRVVKAMPKWNAGKQRGKPVRVQFNMPIKFILQG